MVVHSDQLAEPGSDARLSGVTIRLNDVHVRYRVYEDRRPKFRELVSRRFRPRAFREIHAVRGITLEAKSGEVIGVVGRNGSGKSTLLNTMAGLLPASSGTVWVQSEPRLLGVGAALQSALSGRRNIELGGLALGLKRREIEERMGEIVAFSGLEEAIDRPMRTYSSGMRARLHFAIATCVLPDILLIDEALAVGDEEFKERSQERIAQMQHSAGTVIIVSHSLAALREMCNRAIWIDKGQIKADGDPETITKRYRKSVVRKK
jgi:teichoic acid transport system ATP-binding protein